MTNQNFDHRAWDRAVGRLLHLPGDPHLLLGHHAVYGTPVIVPQRRGSPHTHVMGPPGSGKSARYVGPVLTQTIARRTRSVMVIDAEPSRDVYWCCTVEAADARIPFRAVDLTPGRQSHVFDPFAQSHLLRQNLSQRIATQVGALGLEFGPGRGRGWYAAASESAAADVAARYPCRSFDELARLLDDPRACQFIEREVWQAAAASRLRFRKLAAYPALNPAADMPGVTPEVLANAVDMRQLFHQPQVLYFALNAAEDPAVSLDVAGLAVYHLLAAGAREDGKRCGVDLVIEADQGFVGPALSVLDQARSMDIAVTLVHRHPGHAPSGDADYAEALEGATGLQIVFGPVSQRVRRWIIATGGTATRPRVTWSQALAGREARDADFRLALADAEHPGVPARASVTETEVRAVAENDLIRWSADPRVALVRLLRDEGLARYGGRWMPVVMPYHISRDEYQLRLQEPWPLGDTGTIYVPLESDYDRRFREGPRPSAARQVLRQRIRELREGKQ